MAEVWEATDERLDRAVALKVLLAAAAADAEFRQRFEREARAAARLHHPSIVTVYDVVRDGEIDAIVLELVRGPTLRQRLDEQGVLSPVECVRIGAEIADALEVAHQAGVVHRDVKPANILLPAEGPAKVTDFGIAKAGAAADLTLTGAVLGTAKYVSPEQVEGAPVDGRADVYALAAVLYEAAAGRPPFTGDNPLGIAMARLRQDPPALPSIRRGLPAPLVQAIHHGLARRPEDRPPTAAAFAAALRASDPTTVVPTPTRQHGGAPPRGPGSGTPRPAAPAAPPLQTPPPSPTGRSRRRRRLGWVVPVLLVAAVAVAAVLLARTDAGRWISDRLGDDPAADPPVALPIAAAEELDPPPGDGAEHPERLPAVLDGDPATSWSTETYRSRDLGGRKDGVGLVLVSDGPARMDELLVASPTAGWSAQVYVADAPGSDLSGWGEPLDQQGSIDGDGRFDLGGREGGAVLVWITDLGDGAPSARVEVTDVTLLGTPG